MRDRSDLRSVISAGNQIAEMGYKTKGRNSKEVLDEAERIVFEIAENAIMPMKGHNVLTIFYLKHSPEWIRYLKIAITAELLVFLPGLLISIKNRRVTAFGFNHCGSPSFNGENYFCNELM